uniref:PTB domain-containing protein n=1 Tax=Romanomermis culicivorax TaxID=13658 RepID=A0A915JBS3_ROMCU
MWKYAQKSGNRISDISYPVEHLATFRVGPQFGVQWPEDGVKKLKDMERTSDVWAQKLILKLCRDHLALEDENG